LISIYAFFVSVFSQLFCTKSLFSAKPFDPVQFSSLYVPLLHSQYCGISANFPICHILWLWACVERAAWKRVARNCCI